MPEAGGARRGAGGAGVALRRARGARRGGAPGGAAAGRRGAPTPPRWRRSLLQSHLFLGFPLALEAVRALARGAAAARHAAGRGRGSGLLARARRARSAPRVYGANYRKLRRNVAALHPDLDRWMVEGGYGRVLGRPALDLATRELCIAALLAVWDVAAAAPLAPARRAERGRLRRGSDASGGDRLLPAGPAPRGPGTASCGSGWLSAIGRGLSAPAAIVRPPGPSERREPTADRRQPIATCF